MNLESHSNLLPHNNQPVISAGGHSYWQPAEDQVTVADKAAEVAVIAQKTLTHRVSIIIIALAAAAALSFASYVQISNMRERAYHSKIQRESRIVTL